jgi:hypothetical protein
LLIKTLSGKDGALYNASRSNIYFWPQWFTNSHSFNDSLIQN